MLIPRTIAQRNPLFRGRGVRRRLRMREIPRTLNTYPQRGHRSVLLSVCTNGEEQSRGRGAESRSSLNGGRCLFSSFSTQLSLKLA